MSASPGDTPALPLRNCYWVLPGRLLAGEHPAGTSRDKTRQRLKRLLGAGIQNFVDLTQPQEMPAYDAELPEGIQYLRQPIQDHGLPGSSAHMAQILDGIEASLRSGRPVYVHCRAGIGRTGTVIGCFLVEHGFSGPAAVDELNRLWQQCGRAKSWSFVPETPEQLSYVEAWRPAHRGPLSLATGSRNAGEGRAVRGAAPHRGVDSIEADSTREPDPLLEPDTLSAARGVRDRFLGTLVGLALGDAVAVATQHRRPGTFIPVGDMLGGGPFELPRGGWSDDTAMALCLADSLLECDGFDARDQVGRYVRWQQEGFLSATGQCVGITASTARALAMSKWRRQQFPGSHDPSQLDPEPLARVGPAVLFFFPLLESAIQHSADAARTTCQSPAVLECCRQLARALHAAVSGQTKRIILAEAGRIGPPGETSHSTASTALAAAFWAFGTTDTFRDALLRAANVGGDSDVIATVTGQLAGAHYGVTAIPATWRSSLIQRDLIEGYADRLLAHALVGLGG